MTMKHITMVRSDAGDGGWSLHDQTVLDDGEEYTGSDILLTGTARRIEDMGESWWSRPNKDDWAEAERVRQERTRKRKSAERKHV